MESGEWKENFCLFLYMDRLSDGNPEALWFVDRECWVSGLLYDSLDSYTHLSININAE
jgi:hypothetical protein